MALTADCVAGGDFLSMCLGQEGSGMTPASWTNRKKVGVAATNEASCQPADRQGLVGRALPSTVGQLDESGGSRGGGMRRGF